MDRYLAKPLSEESSKKIAVISGPRQVGKTTLVRALSSSYDYLNFDQVSHRKILMAQSWDRNKRYLILDEIHKMHQWKSWLKGVYDTEETKQKIIVTGSARLDTLKKVGDSLAGRFFPYRMHPIDLEEALCFSHLKTPQNAIRRLMSVGGFPEPFLEGSENFYHRWKASHLDIIIRQDLITTENIRDITSVETLVELLRSRVGSLISYQSLSEDLQKDDKTIKSWLAVLEALFVVFSIRPYQKNVARSLVKSPKYYFYDIAHVDEANESARFENLVACALLKKIQYKNDVEGIPHELFFVRNRQKQEVDFLIIRKNKPYLLIETKLQEDTLSPQIYTFQEALKPEKVIQLVCKNLSREKTFKDHIEVRDAANWLKNMF